MGFSLFFPDFGDFESLCFGFLNHFRALCCDPVRRLARAILPCLLFGLLCQDGVLVLECSGALRSTLCRTAGRCSDEGARRIRTFGPGGLKRHAHHFLVIHSSSLQEIDRHRPVGPVRSGAGPCGPMSHK